MERTILISADGTEVTFLYSDELRPVMDLVQDVKITRASHVRWDSEKKEWCVFVQNEDGTERKLAKTFRFRGGAIDYEISVLEEVLLGEVSKI